MGVRMISENYRQTQRIAEVKQRLAYRRLRKICNASLRCAIECPIWDRKPEHCEFCGNPACIEAKENLDNLWRELP